MREKPNTFGQSVSAHRCCNTKCGPFGRCDKQLRRSVHCRVSSLVAFSVSVPPMNNWDWTLAVHCSSLHIEQPVEFVLFCWNPVCCLFFHTKFLQTSCNPRVHERTQIDCWSECVVCFCGAAREINNWTCLCRRLRAWERAPAVRAHAPSAFTAPFGVLTAVVLGVLQTMQTK